MNIDDANIVVVWLYLKQFIGANVIKANRVLEPEDIVYIDELAEMSDVEFGARVDRERLRHMAWLVNDFTEDWNFALWTYGK